MTAVKRLLVVTHVPHYRQGNTISAYGPYVREMNVWCDLFPEVVIAGPCQHGAADSDGLPFSRENVSIVPIPQSGGESFGSKLWQICLLPWIVLRLSLAMWKADAVHVRCPGNLGLLGVILAPVFCNRLVAKYAGQWNGFPGEWWSVRLQRRLLASRWWRGIVTVYGEWPDQPDHVIPFFTSVMTPQQVNTAKRIAIASRPETFSIVFVGRLSREKNVDILIQSVSQLAQQGITARCTIVGHGAEQDALKELANRLGIADNIDFVGGVEFDRVFDYYSQAHVLVLASETEGWPKVIAEAMACGLVCVGSNRGLVPWMLSEERGFVVTPRDVDDLTGVLRELSSSPQLCRDTAQRAAAFGQQYSLDSLRDALGALLSESWQTPIGPSDSADEPCPNTTDAMSDRKVVAQ